MFVDCMCEYVLVCLYLGVFVREGMYFVTMRMSWERHNVSAFCVHVNVDFIIVPGVAAIQMAQFNFILVIGDREVESHTVSVRTRDNVDHGAHPLDWVMSVMKDLVERRGREDCLDSN